MPATLSHSHRTLSAGAILALSLLVACDSESVAPDTESTAIRQLQTGEFEALVLDIRGEEGLQPSGLAFSSSAAALWVVSESSLFAVLPRGEVLGGLAGFAVTDPLNLAYDGYADRLLALDNDAGRLLALPARGDGSLDVEDLQELDARSFGVRQPGGMAVDPANGDLYILDSHGPRVFRVDGAALSGPDVPTAVLIDLEATELAAARGIAFDPGTGTLHVLDVDDQRFYEFETDGTARAVRYLTGTYLRRPGSMAFGPSADATDDPSDMSLYVADAGSPGGGAPGRILELVSVARAVETASSSLVQTILASQFSPSSPDAAGITFLGHMGQLLISDSEVNETPLYDGVNQFRMTAGGTFLGGYTTLTYSEEPTGVAWNPRNNHIFYSDDDRHEIYELDPGADGEYGTSDDIVTSFDTQVFGSEDPEGVAFDAAEGVLYIADGINSEVYGVSPGANGVFDGVAPAGDDQVTQFDTEIHGLVDPEGIAFDREFGHLYVVGRPHSKVFHFTRQGSLLRIVDISAAPSDKPAGLTHAPGSLNPDILSLWIADRGVDNGADSSENDGRVYEMAVEPYSGNALPTVAVTSPADGSGITEGDPVTFAATATDPEDGDLAPTLTWTSSLDGVIGTGGSFTTSTLSRGTHRVTASATDSGGLDVADVVNVVVTAEGARSLEVRVSDSYDDAEESPDGNIDRTSLDLELVDDDGNQNVGMRFNGISIPRGAEITSAYIQFQADERDSGTAELTIQGEATDNADTFADVDHDISTRPRTASSVSWVPPAWNSTGVSGPDQRTSDLSTVIQEIVDRSGWASGNSLAIIITGSGKRVAESYDGTSSGAPLLHIDYVVELAESTRWRILVRASDGNAIELREVEFRDAVGGVDQTGAVGGTASASDVLGGSSQPASNAFDDNVSTYWLTNEPTTFPGWLEFEFNDPVSVVEFTIQITTAGGGRNPVDFDLQYYQGGAWVTVRSFDGVVWTTNSETQAFAGAAAGPVVGADAAPVASN